MTHDRLPRRLPQPPVFRVLAKDDCGDDDGLVCPLLLEKIGVGREVAVCGDCGTIYDAAAWRENRGCASLGCASAPDARRDAPESVLRVTEADVARARPPAPPPLPAFLPPPSPAALGGARAAQPPPPLPPVRPLPRWPSQPASWFPPPLPPPVPPPRPYPAQAPWSPPPLPPPLPAVPALRPIERPARTDEAGKCCPYSMEPFAAGDALAECPKCGQVLSLESWRENRGCTTYGCEGAPDFRKDAHRPPPPIL